ncbi:MAG TPA: hypothetical protein VE826_12490 [Dongiaceae bacterium]|nr:hypothetical protein [Dongiaceae bacterium]
MRFGPHGSIRAVSTNLRYVIGSLLAAGTLCAVAPAPNAPPRITGVSITPADLRSGEHVTATVLTSGDATRVVAHVARRELVIPRVKDGVFSGSAVMPHIPRFIHLHVSVTFIATGPAGNSDQQTTSVKVN